MTKFHNIGILGLGLIGGSVALDCKRKKLAKNVIGFSRRISTLKKAKKNKFIDAYFLDFKKGIKEIDFLVIATPINIIENYFKIIKEINPNMLITDVASIKEKIVEKAEKILGKNSNFVGSHPIAGSEKAGIEFSQEGLFEGKTVVVTPTNFTNKNSLNKIACFWESLGGKVFYLSPKEHDYILGLTSHLPHFIVFSLLKTLSRLKIDRKNIFEFIGTGFKDTTRIGKSNPELWVDIFFSNKKNLLFWIKEFEKSLYQLKNKIEENSFDKLLKDLHEIKKIREEIDE